MGEIRPFSSRKSRIWLIIAIVLGAVVIDQVIKILVATHMMLNTVEKRRDSGRLYRNNCIYCGRGDRKHHRLHFLRQVVS